MKPWEGVYPVPDLQMEQCPWCRKPASKYVIVLYESNQPSPEIGCEPICEKCAVLGPDFIAMRKQGINRKMILKDFDLRG